jgi:F420-dependent oxidoreductase-like protein
MFRGVGVGLPAGDDIGDNVVDHFLDRAREARDTGLPSVWFSQRLDHDALSVATAVAAVVPEIGTAVVPVYSRHPLVVSSQAQTAQAASHGRFTLGLGLGARAVIEPAFGVSAARPIRHLREYLTVLRSLLDTGSVDFDGQTITAHSLRPARVSGADPAPSVLVAAMGPQTLRVAGELADGTLPYLAGARTISEFIVPAITAAAQRAGRPAPRVVAAISVVVTDDVPAVRAKAQTAMAIYDSIPFYRTVLDREGVAHAADLAVIGDEATVNAALARYVEAGATEIIAAHTALHTEADRRRTWATLAQFHRDHAQPH